MDDLVEQFSSCPVCGGHVGGFCIGHGESGDPVGYLILKRHNEGNHFECHPEGCDEYDSQR